MKKLHFNSKEDFLKELDGKVYAVSGKDGNFLCDVLENDLHRLLDSGDIIDLCNKSASVVDNAYSDYIIAPNINEDDFKEMYGVSIEY